MNDAASAETARIDGVLADLLEQGKAEECLDHLAAIAPRERRTRMAQIFATWKRFESGEMKEVEPGSWRWTTDYDDQQRDAARVALLATCTEGELAKHADRLDLTRAVEVWQRTRPEFLARAAQIVITATTGHFRVAHELVRLGLSERPTHENYTLALVSRGFVPFRREKPVTIADQLRTWPDLLAHDVWRLFEVEGHGDTSLAAHDKYTRAEHTWSAALLELMQSGELDRQRLIDATLSALERDFAPFRAGWFSRFYTALAVTAEERAARSARFIALLGSVVPATVTLALTEIRALEKEAPVTAADLVPALGRVALARQKSTAKACLALLRGIADRDPSARSDVARGAVNALAHEAADVQKAALDLLDRVADPADGELSARIAEAAPGVAATLANRLAKYVAEARAVAPTAAVSPVEIASEPYRPLDPAHTIAPISSVDELLYAWAHVLEDDGDPIEVERVIDALVRLAPADPNELGDRAGPLIKRAKKLSERYWERPIIHCLACLALAWTAPLGQGAQTFVDYSSPDADRDEKRIGFATLFFQRALGIAELLDRTRGCQLLSTPTHRGGFIDPAVLAKRLEQPDVVMDLLDGVIALLRLPADARSDAESIARRLAPPAASADDSAPLVAAAAARALPASWRVTARKSGSYTFRDLRLETDRALLRTRSAKVEYPAEILYHPEEFAQRAGWTKSLVRWAFSVWPAGSEAFYFDALPSLAGNINWSGAEWHNVAFYEQLREPYTSLGELGRVALGIGLGAKEPGESGVATDAAIAALSEARIDGAALGETLAQLRDSGIITLKRWSRTLGIVARSSPAHAHHVIAAIERTLRGDPKRAPRDEGALVALLCELLAEQSARIQDREAWAYLCASRHKKTTALYAPE